MSITWQDAAATAIVLGALAYVVRAMVRWARRKAAPPCGCCPKCPSQQAKPPLISLTPKK
jgi:hypothetical protein